MLNEQLIPNRLIADGDRPKVIVVEATKPSRFWVLHFLNVVLRWIASFLWPLILRKLTREEYARRFRELLEELGGLWVKAGQLLSLRVDMFSMEFCSELAKLQHRAVGFPPEMAKKTVERELGAPLERYFDSFDEDPFGAASLAQIHRAHLRTEGVWVAVKVQRPSLELKFKHDFLLIQWVVRFLRIFSILPFMRWEEGLYELRQIMHEEIDYRYEASAMRRMKKTLRRHKVYVPEVFPQYTTQRVLVTEFVEAALMADFIEAFVANPAKLSNWLEENNINPQLVARRLILSIFRQLFEDNLYHGDLHPGNILLLRNSNVAFIDLGTVGFTEREFLEKTTLFASALSTRDYSKAADMTLLMISTLPVTDIEPVRNDLITMLQAWAARTLVRELPYHEKSMDNALVGVTKLLFRHKITMEWAFLRIRRALTTLDSSLIHLFPDADYTKLTAQYFRGAEKRALVKATSEQVLPRAANAMKSALELAELAYEHVFYQEPMIRRRAQVFEEETGKFTRLFVSFFRQVALVQIFIGIFLLVTFLYQHHGDWIRPLMGSQFSTIVDFLPRLDYSVWSVILIIAFYFCATSARLMRRLSENSTERWA